LREDSRPEGNLKSKIFIGNVQHVRTQPIKYFLGLKHFMFFLDMDNLNYLDNFYPLLSYKKRGIFNFNKKDHYILRKKDLKPHFRDITKKDIDKVYLLTNLRFLKYVFNPISVFFCFDKKENLSSVIYEVGNTFKEQKIYDNSFIEGPTASLKTKKFFYVSPFIPLDTVFNFFSEIKRNKKEDESIFLKVDSIQNEDKILTATFSAKSKEITIKNLIVLIFFFPFQSLKVIFLIHWHAFILWFKKLKYIKKNDNQEKQKEVLYG